MLFRYAFDECDILPMLRFYHLAEFSPLMPTMHARATFIIDFARTTLRYSMPTPPASAQYSPTATLHAAVAVTSAEIRVNLIT